MPIPSRISSRLFGFISPGPHALLVSSRTTAAVRTFTTSSPTPFASSTSPARAIVAEASPVSPVIASTRPAYRRPIFPRFFATSATATATATMGSLPEASHAVRVFIAGGCYAGLAAAANLLDLSKGLKPRMSEGPYAYHPDLPGFDVDITIVDERDGYYHLIGTPMAFADSDYAGENWVKHSDLPGLQLPNVRVIQGSVAGINAQAKTATVSRHLTGEKTTHEYDFFIAATGLRRVFPVAPQSLTRKQYLVEAESQIKACENAKHGVVVVGGGAVGIEMAAELKMVKPHVKVTLVHSRDKLLSSEGLPDETKDVALELLEESGVEVLMNHRLATTKPLETTDGSKKQEIEFTNGHKLIASEVVMAISRSVPTTTYLPPNALDSEGYVHIRPNLNFAEGFPNADSHFAAGDITKWTGIKRCGAAMHQGHYAAMNLYQRVVEQRTGQKPSFNQLNEVPPMIGLAVGKKAVAYSPDSGTIFGEDVAHAYFRDDLGWGICWNWIGLGPRKEQAKA